MNTSGQTVLITGGAGGIGLALARAFAQAGNTVIICGRRLEALARARAEVGNAETAQCDISSEDSVRALADAFADRVTILINNAGISGLIDLRDVRSGFAAQQAEIEINLIGTLRMTHAFLPGLLAKPAAAIVNVTSALAFIPSADRPVYCATKAAVHSLTRSMRLQLRHSGVKVFELMPPLTDTSMADNVVGIPKLAPEKVASALIRAMSRDRYEITPGLARATKWMSRIAPEFGFSKLNQAVS